MIFGVEQGLSRVRFLKGLNNLRGLKSLLVLKNVTGYIGTWCSKGSKDSEGAKGVLELLRIYQGLYGLCG